MGAGAVQGTCFNNQMIFISMEIMINPGFRHPLDSLEIVFDYDLHRKWLSVEMIDGCGLHYDVLVVSSIVEMSD